jgi:uncharacterized protein (TIGR03435 family)
VRHNANMVRSPLPLIAILVLAGAVVNFPAAAQNEFKFEVLSIHPLKRGAGGQLAITNPTPNGFTATAWMNQLLTFAYGPPAPAWKVQVWQITEMRNLPGWTSEEAYAIDARVSQADLKAWQNQNPKTQDLLHSALRAALKERFKLAVHEEPAQRTIFQLVVAKRGPRLKPAVPGAILPVGVKLESGGVMTAINPRGADGWNFHGATMQDLADLMLQAFYDGPVRDRTGLTGRYDFQVRIVPTDEPRGYAYAAFTLSDIGLELKRGTENRPVLVIDHLERPTPN